MLIVNAISKAWKMLFGIHWYLVALSVIVYFGIGAVWYSPLMFVEPWKKALGKKPNEVISPAAAMVVTFLAMIVLVCIEAYFITATGTNGWMRGGYLGLKLWLGFAAMTGLINNVYQSGNKTLFAIDQ